MTFYVYSCFDADRRPLYVGCTNDVRRRMKEHAGYNAWPSQVALMAVLPFATRREAELEESRRIAKYRPVHNVRDNPRYRTVAVAQAREQWHQDFLSLNRDLFGGAA